MIELTQDEVNAFNILAVNSSNLQQQLNQSKSAQDAFIKLLEIKYKAVFDPQSGQLKLKEKKRKAGE